MPKLDLINLLINTGKRTEWSPIRSVIVRVITKYNESVIFMINSVNIMIMIIIIIINNNNVRHVSGLHFCSSLAGPWTLQSAPPCCGDGLVHVLLLCCTPPPQVTLHSPHELHSVYFPSIAEKENTRCMERATNVFLFISTLEVP